MTGSANFYLNWAKERIDEMDAVLNSLEGKAAQVSADARAAAEKIVVELRTRRDTFLEDMKKHAEANEATWERRKAELETEWNGFQEGVKRYVVGFGQQLKQQEATFEQAAAAQVKSWREAADKIKAASADLSADHKARVEAAVQQMKAGSAAAEMKLQQLAKAGAESWAAFDAALAESRAAFDRANQTAWDTFKRAA
jgi:hypothetical protein